MATEVDLEISGYRYDLSLRQPCGMSCISNTSFQPKLKKKGDYGVPMFGLGKKRFLDYFFHIFYYPSKDNIYLLCK